MPPFNPAGRPGRAWSCNGQGRLKPAPTYGGPQSSSVGRTAEFGIPHATLRRSAISVETIRRPPSYSDERLFRGLLELPAYWDLLVVLTTHRIKVRYKQSLL